MGKKTNSRPAFYESVVPGYLSGYQVPSLRVLAAQKIYEMNQKRQLTPIQLVVPEVAICNELLTEDFLHMRKDRAQAYSLNAFGTCVPPRGRGNVAQKVQALEMMIKANS
jgi:hypothetical protein